MKLENDWIRGVLAIGMYFSCLIFALSIFQIPKEMSSGGIIPLRIIIMLSIATAILVCVAYFSEEAAWKTILKLATYILCLCLFGVIAFGLRIVFSHLFGEPANIGIAWGLSISACGAITILGLGKILKSQWLN